MFYPLAMAMALVLSTLCLPVQAGEPAPQSVVDKANTVLAGYGNDAILAAAVKAQNGKGMTLDDIQSMDAKWRDTPGVADFMKPLMASECGKHLVQIMDDNPAIVEIFVMDNQGANVCMTNKTSDYWQGDEDKFQKSFAGGAGAVFVDEVEFDDSAQAYLVQVSVPVKDGDTVIGAMTLGVDVDQL